MYFALITFEKLSGFNTKKFPLLGHFYTLFFVIIGWVIFREDSLSGGLKYIAKMFGFKASGFIDEKTIFYFMEYKYYYLFALLFSMPITKFVLKKILLDNKISQILYPIGMVSLFLITISFVVKGSYNPFIYFKF
jgi:alginate O-acetyltransferase complex protein AlgI